MGGQTIVDYTDRYGVYVENATIIQTTDDTYPSGYKYRLHYGKTDGTTLLRYDNSHERINGHEKHTPQGRTEIEFPGMMPLYRRFIEEVASLPP